MQRVPLFLYQGITSQALLYDSVSADETFEWYVETTLPPTMFARAQAMPWLYPDESRTPIGEIGLAYGGASLPFGPPIVVIEGGSFHVEIDESAVVEDDADGHKFSWWVPQNEPVRVPTPLSLGVLDGNEIIVEPPHVITGGPFYLFCHATTRSSLHDATLSRSKLECVTTARSYLDDQKLYGMPLSNTQRVIRENTTAPFTAYLKDHDGVALAAADITTLTLTYYDERTGEVINSRDSQDVLNTNNVTVHATSGLVTWTVQQADAVLVGDGVEVGRTERHVALFQWTYDSGNQAGSDEVNLDILNVGKV